MALWHIFRDFAGFLFTAFKVISPQTVHPHKERANGLRAEGRACFSGLQDRLCPAIYSFNIEKLSDFIDRLRTEALQAFRL